MALPGHPLLDPHAPVVVTRHTDGSYDWLCRGCGKRHERYPPHRGPRRRLCRSCQNVRAYRRKYPVGQRRSWQSARYENWQLNYRDLRGGRD